MPNYSMKPGRGPSAMGVVGGVFGILFIVGWLVMASRIASDAPREFGVIRILPLCFGILVLIATVVGLFYNLHNARSPNRFSEFDIVQSESEPDPFAPRPTSARPAQGSTGTAPAGYCRQCGAVLRPGDRFCGQCGQAA